MTLKKKLIFLGIVVLALLLCILMMQDTILKRIYPKTYEEYVYTYARENEVDPLLIFAIIKAESNFKPNAISSSGAIGLMQLMPSTAKEAAGELQEELIVKEALYNPEKNIMIGTRYFSNLLKKYDGNMLLSLTAYNAGIGNVDRWIEEGILKEDGSNIENIPYKETNNYVRKIVRDYKIYQKLYKEEVK